MSENLGFVFEWQINQRIRDIFVAGQLQELVMPPVGDRVFLFALAKIFLKQCAIYSCCGEWASRHGKGDLLVGVNHIAASIDA